MILVKPQIELPVVVDRTQLALWRSKQQRSHVALPERVHDFIHAVAAKLGDFARYQEETRTISGHDLQLCGIHTWKNETVYPWRDYELKVPVMQAVDHVAAMQRIYLRKGKQGLINYCRARVKGTELAHLLDILHVHVFNEERPQFLQVLNQIKASRTLEVV